MARRFPKIKLPPKDKLKSIGFAVLAVVVFGAFIGLAIWSLTSSAKKPTEVPANVPAKNITQYTPQTAVKATPGTSSTVPTPASVPTTNPDSMVNQYQYVMRHPPVDIDAVNESEEGSIEQPATVDYPSPVPFKFEANPAAAEDGIGSFQPAFEFKNEGYMRLDDWSKPAIF